jgi:predicted AlkP superfamily phosphohydrolase/phosphomutase
MARVVTIGLDGATFDLIQPWVQANQLPNFARLLSQGAHGELATTFPPMTFPAWTSFMTGKNPGKHNVFDFTQRERGGYGLRFVNATQRRAKTLWQILSEAGRRVAVVSVPVTFPPEEVNGLMISGFDAPGMSGGTADERSMYPASLHRELLEKLGGYIISSNAVALAGNPDRAIRAILETLDHKIRCAEYLYRKEPWDFFMVLLGETDLVAHHFWRFQDPGSPLRATPPSPACGDAILRVYQRADAFLGTMLDEAQRSGATVIVVSDHGMGGCGDTGVYLNLWLAQEGFLRFRTAPRETGGSTLRSVARRAVTASLRTAKEVGVKVIPPRYKRWLLRHSPALVNSVESYLRFNAIDWGATRAFAEENPYYPPIWINLQGREPQGTVAPGSEYEDLRAQLAVRLRTWRDPDTGESVVKRVLKREEIYEGPYVGGAPDLLVDFNLKGQYSYVPRVSRPHESTVPLRSLGRADRAKLKSGSHRDLGVLMAFGAGIRPAAKVVGAHIMDVTPTVLYLLGLEVPGDMDGKVIEDVLDEELLRNRPVVGSGGPAAPDAGSPDETYSEDEAAVIEERLRSLGYLE